MKILFLNYEYPPLGGGAGNATEYLLREYAKIPDLEVHLVTSSVDDEYHRLSVGTGTVTVHSVPIGKNATTLHFQSIIDILRYSWSGYSFAKKLLTESHFDAIHAFFSVPCGAQAYFLGKQFKLSYIVSLRGADVPGFSERFGWIYGILIPIIQKVWKHACAVVAVSEGMKWLALTTSPKQEIKVIYNGVNTEDFFPDVLQQPKNKFIITLGATRITTRKGIEYLIQAVAMLLSHYPHISLEIMGDGNDKVRLETMVRDLCLQDTVKFFGRIPREKTFSYYQKAHIFVLPSMNEGMSNAMLEALASGLPIVATDTGGSKELVTDGINGYIIKMQSAEDIAEKIKRLIENPALRRSMAEASRARALTMSWKNIADAYHRLYQQAMKKQ